MVSELTFRELIALPLKSGQRPPLLLDVLQSAHTIGNGSQLVVEIKPGSTLVAGALCELVSKYPYLSPAIGVVMSFDLFCIHEFTRTYRKIKGTEKPFDDKSSGFKIMLLTVSDPNEKAQYLFVNIMEGETLIADWLTHPDSSLDGVYLQYEPVMRTDEGIEVLKRLAAKYTVGIWGIEPDEQNLAEFLMMQGISFVNTDLPRGFSLRV